MQTYETDSREILADLWETHSFRIDGMTCDNCAKTVTKTLKRVNGVKNVNVDRNAAAATVTFDITKTELAVLHEALLKAGFPPSPLS